MFPNRKIIRRGGKFKSRSDQAEAVGSDVAGADVEKTILDVVPEARALYRGHEGKSKRKLSSPAREMDQPDSSTWSSGDQSWKRYRERRQINRQSLGIDESDESDEAGEHEDEDDEDQMMTSIDPRASLVRKPRRKRRIPTYMETLDLIDEMMNDFRLQDETYKRIMTLLEEEMGKGLRQQTHHSSTVRMYPTYVRSKPDGSESGRFLALDLGGTNFRVLLVNLNGREQPDMTSKVFLIPKRIMIGSGVMLFEHIARCIAEFLDEHGLKGEGFQMGFTFSFPCYQDGLAAARLVRWTKGFKCAGVEGKDVVRMLHDAIKRRNDLNVECIAIINDPVGALMAEAHSDKNCQVGLILGTGTNCCYMEELEKVELWDEDLEEPRQVIVNTEWGAFGDNGVLDFLRNAYDKELDKMSLNPGHQLFEKMISGMYMGELVRLVLCQLTADGLLFGGEGSEELFTPNRFYTKYISEIESDDPEGNFSNTKIVLQELDIEHFTTDDCRHVAQVCWHISQRAAYLAATAVATIIIRLKMPDVTVAVDGSLYRFHPHFHDLMYKKITQLVGPNQKFKLSLAHDGSGRGAALVAAVAQRVRQAQRQNMMRNNQNNNSSNISTLNIITDDNTDNVVESMDS